LKLFRLQLLFINNCFSLFKYSYFLPTMENAQNSFVFVYLLAIAVCILVYKEYLCWLHSYGYIFVYKKLCKYLSITFACIYLCAFRFFCLFRYYNFYSALQQVVHFCICYWGTFPKFYSKYRNDPRAKPSLRGNRNNNNSKVST